MSLIVVTGAAGFIGSHLCERLLDRGDTVIGLDNFDPFYDPAIKRTNISRSLDHDAFTLIEGDICDSDAVDKLFAERPDAVVHLAARAGVRPSILEPKRCQEVNVGGTTIVLDAARHSGVPNFILASSSSVYGNNKKIPFAETDNVDYPISPYAASKKSAELIAHSYAHLFEMNMTCLRFFTVYGPRQRPDLAIHKFTKLIDDGQPIPVFGDGSTSRDYTYIDDIIDGTIRAIDRCKDYHVYNLGESEPIRLDELIAAIEKALDREAKIERMPLQPGDVDRTFANITRARTELGYQPATGMEEGLANFIKWFREQHV
ncbi:MAG: NAD-dependent epimerase/dehydratase family protein [Planctomycetes bacterium]|nr:NAD-dependent epimerase/dehydratase family protein [Planctomycetota bacterium]